MNVWRGTRSASFPREAETLGFNMMQAREPAGLFRLPDGAARTRGKSLDGSRSGMPPGVSFKNLNLVRDAEY